MQIFVRYMKMPTGVKGFTIREDADTYDVYINPAYCYAQQVETYEHEMEHIRNGDFERNGEVNEMELMI